MIEQLSGRASMFICGAFLFGWFCISFHNEVKLQSRLEATSLELERNRQEYTRNLEAMHQAMQAREQLYESFTEKSLALENGLNSHEDFASICLPDDIRCLLQQGGPELMPAAGPPSR